ncbi:MAG: hypothetical protein KC766_03820 [Myxococcales bacterium]|nr:hypothetical protein [Myxococcales bacterium]
MDLRDWLVHQDLVRVSAKPRVRRCGWKLLEQSADTLKISLDDAEVVVIRFDSDDALQLTTPEGKGAQRFIRSGRSIRGN